MFVVGIATAALVASLIRVARLRRDERVERTESASRHTKRHKASVSILAAAMGTALLVPALVASAAIVPTVELGTSANYAVLAGTTVTNTGPSVLAGSVGVSPGSSVTGFPPGLVTPPGVIDIANGPAGIAQSDLTAAYLDAAGRPINAETTVDLGGLILVGGVYAGPSRSELTLAGELVLDGEGDPNSVFIFQTDSTLITASGSTVSLINGAQGCNVFWQVGSSATLGTDSVFVGNILALTSITVTNGVTVHGRALARNAAVTLDNDVFVQPTCDMTPGTTTTTTTVPGTTSTTLPEGTTSTTQPDSGTTSTLPAGETTTTSMPLVVSTSAEVGADQELPLTGVSVGVLALLGLALVAAGFAALRGVRTGRN